MFQLIRRSRCHPRRNGRRM